jgi:hypothetical protein
LAQPSASRPEGLQMTDTKRPVFRLFPKLIPRVVRNSARMALVRDALIQFTYRGMLGTMDFSIQDPRAVPAIFVLWFAG